MADVPGRVAVPRATAEYVFSCYASPGYFIPWENVPEALKDELDANGHLPCEGSGGVGPWCTDCRFGAEEEVSRG